MIINIDDMIKRSDVNLAYLNKHLENIKQESYNLKKHGYYDYNGQIIKFDVMEQKFKPVSEVEQINIIRNINNYQSIPVTPIMFDCLRSKLTNIEHIDLFDADVSVDPIVDVADIKADVLSRMSEIELIPINAYYERTVNDLIALNFFISDKVLYRFDGVDLLSYGKLDDLVNKKIRISDDVKHYTLMFKEKIMPIINKILIDVPFETIKPIFDEQQRQKDLKHKNKLLRILANDGLI